MNEVIVRAFGHDPAVTSEVNLEGLTLFFNIDTVTYAMSHLREGMTWQEMLEALDAAGFEDEIATALINKMTKNMTIWFDNGVLGIEGGGLR